MAQLPHTELPHTARLHRHATLIDSSHAAVKVIKNRLAFAGTNVRKAV